MAGLGAKTFCAFCHPNDQCGVNGLPLTPNSIRIVGRFQELRGLRHPHLCQYLDISRSKHERLIIVGEHYRTSVRQAAANGLYSSEAAFVDLAHQCLLGLSYLHERNIVHRNITPDNILLNVQDQVKLSDYGLYYMTNSGRDVAFPIGSLKYLAPEVIIQGPVPCVQEEEAALVGPKSDIWSLGVALLEVYLGCEIWPALTLQQTTRRILSLVSEKNVLRQLTRDVTDQWRVEQMPERVCEFLRACLTVSGRERPSSRALLNTELFIHRQRPLVTEQRIICSKLRCLHLKLDKMDEEEYEGAESVLRSRDLSEVYYLWRLSGGSLEALLKREGLIKSRPPVTMMPGFVLEDGEPFGAIKDHSSLYDPSTVSLSLEQLVERIAGMDDAALWPLLEGEEECRSQPKLLHASPSCASLHETASLPAVIKERDVEYQFHRMLLYHRLLLGYPAKRPRVWAEARVDVPPYWRALVWAALLEVESDYQERYDEIDKVSATSTDRQIEVDIPRCHQYDELLSSVCGHSKLKRLLKAWVVTHPQYVYWQGLDSLAAPFLSLNFNDEALAFACLVKFIPKYLNKFFLKDNSKVIQEYLCVFGHLIAFHDPELSSHLDGVGFIPDLYAIPWFLTMYAHVFPLHKIYHLWDTLILGNSSFPLCIGVAILQQLKQQHNLMMLGFNECILLFSDMPQIDIDRCVADSIKIFCNTPKSSTYRQYARPVLTRVSRSERTGKPGSYYSQDYNELPTNPLSMDPVLLEELRLEKCPRISAEDLIELCELRQKSPSRSPVKRTKSGKPRLIVIDVRNQEDYHKGTIPGSLNIPYSTAFNSQGELNQSSSVQTLNQCRSLVKVVFGSRGRNVIYFANELVRLGYQKVCILHKGIDVMHQTGLLTVPSMTS